MKDILKHIREKLQKQKKATLILIVCLIILPLTLSMVYTIHYFTTRASYPYRTSGYGSGSYTNSIYNIGTTYTPTPPMASDAATITP